MVITHSHDGGPPSRHAFVGPVFTVGRRAGSGIDLVLGQMTIARRHCQFVRRDGVVWVEDINAPNGMYVNDVMLRGARIVHSGDEIYLHQKNTLTVEDDELTEAQVAEAVARASDPATPGPALRTLSGVLDRRVAQAVARNPSVPVGVLRELVRACPAEVASNPILPLLLLERPDALDRLHAGDYANLASQPTLPLALLEQAARSPLVSVRMAVASNPAAPEPVLRMLTGDEDPRVARMAAEALGR